MDRRSFLTSPLAAAAATALPAAALAVGQKPKRRLRVEGGMAWATRARVVNAATGQELRGVTWAEEWTAKIGVCSLDPSALQQFDQARALELGAIDAAIQCTRVEIDLPRFEVRVWL